MARPASARPARPRRRRRRRPCRPDWTDAVAIEAEERCVALRHRTNDDGLVVPTELPGTSGAVWFHDGRCVDVLAERSELQQERPQ